MAGEKRGNLYEFVVGQALRYAFPRRQVETQVTMEDSLVRSDWIVRGDVPWVVFVTHSSTETKNTQKFWRDCAELLQALRATRGRLISVGVVFDAHLLAQLVDAEAALMDGLVLADRLPDVGPLIRLSDTSIERIDARKNDDFEAVLARTDSRTRGVLREAVAALSRRFSSMTSPTTNRPAMAHLLREPRSITEELQEASQFYTGCAALMLVEGEERLDLLNAAAKNRIPDGTPSYFAELGGADSVGGTRPSAPLRWLATRIPRELVVAALNGEETEKSTTYRAMLRAGDYLPAWVGWVKRHGKNSSSVLRLLVDSFRTPQAAAERVLGCAPGHGPRFNWAWTFLVTTMREIRQKKQAFGAATVAAVTGNRRLCVQNSILSDFECGTRDLDASDLSSLARYFAAEIGEGGSLDPAGLRGRLLHEVFVDKIGPHSVHPIPALVREVARRSDAELETVWLPTSIGRMAGATGNAARVRVLRRENQVIWWRSAFDGHEADKAKEVGARIFGMTTEWDQRSRRLSRPSTRRFALVVDGDFSPEHLGFFEACGADTLLRPEMIVDRIPQLLGG